LVPVRSVSSRPCSCSSTGSVWRSSTCTGGRPSTVTPSRSIHALHILDEAGLSEGLIGAGRKLTKVAYYEGRERRAKIDYSSLASQHPYLLVIRQSVLERAAEEALRRRKLKVLWGHQLQGLTVERATVRAEVAKLDQDQEDGGAERPIPGGVSVIVALPSAGMAFHVVEAAVSPQSGHTNSRSGCRTVRTGHDDLRTMRSATLPINSRLAP
jgi:hypothetical protein